MTNITADWPQILNFARDYGLPAQKKRAILREYLQTKIISLIYAQKLSRQLFFVGGTALRLLYGLDRFSEDLDFDAPGVKRESIKTTLESIAGLLAKENLAVDFYHNPKTNKDYYEYRFPDQFIFFPILISSGASLRPPVAAVACSICIL